MKPFIFEIKVQAEEVFAGLQAHPYSLWLDSADRKHTRGKFSYIAAFPAETIELHGDRVTVTNANQQTKLSGDPFKIIQDRMEVWKRGAEIIEGLPPFQGGLAGFFGYDMVRSIEKLPDAHAPDPHMPDMAIGVYDVVAAFDHEKKKAWVIVHADNEKKAMAKKEIFLKNANVPPAFSSSPVAWSAVLDKDDYIGRIEKTIAYIRAGDMFQANLSQRFEAVLPPGFNQFLHYMHLRSVNAAPFATYMNLGFIKIASASPEQFLAVREGQIETRPIKGTCPRSQDPQELINSRKDRAENIMIVDLLRNDLSKVCVPDSVEVSDLCGLETFATVHHLVSTIKGKLKESKNAFDALKACFPGGSITGAPKIRAMEIIDELETTRRGPYCGSAGWIGFDGAMDSNILIRTLVYRGNKVSLNVGGGITADSVPAQEYQETLDKAAAMLRSFEPGKGKVKAA